jgi:hypothetical protein
VIANGCLRKEARREHLDCINKGLLSKPDQGAKLSLAHCNTSPCFFVIFLSHGYSDFAIFQGQSSIEENSAEIAEIVLEKKWVFWGPVSEEHLVQVIKTAAEPFGQ